MRRLAPLALLLLASAMLASPSGAQLNTNRDPYACAGPDQSVGEQEAVHLNAQPPSCPGRQDYPEKGSFDLDVEDNEGLKFRWTLVSCSPSTSPMCSPAPTLTGASTPTPCILTRYLAPGEPSAVITLEVYVDDGKAPTTPSPQQLDRLTVTVRNVDQPPHGVAAGIGPTCSDPYKPSAIQLDIQPQDVDCIEDLGSAITFQFKSGTQAIVYDDVGVIGGTVSISNGPGMNHSVPLKASDRQVETGGIWNGQTKTKVSGTMPSDHPFLKAGTYKVEGWAFDEAGGRADTGDQEPEFTFSCDYTNVYGFEMELVGHPDTQQTYGATCFQPEDRAPVSTKVAPIPFGPNALLRVEPKFPLLEGASPPDTLGQDTAVPYLLHKITYQVCVGRGAGRVVGPEVELPSPWFLDIGSIPPGAQEVLFRGYSRDGREVQVLAILTADQDAPEVLVMVPSITHFGVPFDLLVYVHDVLPVNATLEMEDVDFNAIQPGQQPRLVIASTDLQNVTYTPSIAKALRLDVPTVKELRYSFDRVDDYVFDDNGDGRPDGYVDAATQKRTTFQSQDCTGDQKPEMVVPGPDGKPCTRDDVILALRECPPAGATTLVNPKSILDANENGRCDRQVRVAGKTVTESYVALLDYRGLEQAGLVQGKAVASPVAEFLKGGPAYVFRFPVLRTVALGNCTWVPPPPGKPLPPDAPEPELDHAFLDLDSDGTCGKTERYVRVDYDDPEATQAAASALFGNATFRITVVDAAHNELRFRGEQEIPAGTPGTVLDMESPVQYSSIAPERFTAGIGFQAGGRPWTRVDGAPAGDQFRVDAANRTIVLGRPIPGGSDASILYPQLVETRFVSADVTLEDAAVEGREPRTASDTFLRAPQNRTDPPLAILAGDLIRFNATIGQQGGLVPVFAFALFGLPEEDEVDDEDAVLEHFGHDCEDIANVTFSALPPDGTARQCFQQAFPPGVHTLTVVAATASPLDIETDFSDQLLNVTFEVYLGAVRYTPPGQTTPVEYYIRAGSNGLPRLEGGVIDPATDTTYDLTLDQEFRIEDETGRGLTLDAYTFTIEQTVPGESERMQVTLFWDPLQRCDVANLTLCGLDPADFNAKDGGECRQDLGEVCRLITVIPTVTEDNNPDGPARPFAQKAPGKDSPGPGLLALLAAIALAIVAWRRRQ